MIEPNFDRDTRSSIRRYEAQRRRSSRRLAGWIIAGSVVVLGGGGAATWFALQSGGGSSSAISKTTPLPRVDSTPLPTLSAPQPEFPSPLTGLAVKDQSEITKPVTAVMIENSLEARPQSGLKSAGVIFEAQAEGGITRFLAIFQDEKPQLIGPVRSVRTYYLDWVTPFNASIAHVGGSVAALEIVRGGNYRDLDQFFNETSYWRATDREAPHNVYTSFEELDALNSAKGYTTSNFTGFTRLSTKMTTGKTATGIQVTVGDDASFNSSYIYNQKTNLYARSEGGRPHLDRESGQLTPRVVVVIRVERGSVSGQVGTNITTGTGEAQIFQDGFVQQGTWHKDSRDEQLTFTDSAGKDIPLARGQTWITAIPSDGSVSWH